MRRGVIQAFAFLTVVAPQGVRTSSEATVEVRGLRLYRFHYLSGANNVTLQRSLRGRNRARTGPEDLRRSPSDMLRETAR